jgi:hypothetical protein
MTTPLRLIVALALIASAAIAFAAHRQAEQPGTATDAFTIRDLAWLEGTWTSRFDENELEEIWSRPNAKSMMGMFRWSRGGESWMYELMTIEQEEAGLVFRLRHFDAQMMPWEKEGPLTYSVQRAGETAVTFENPEITRPRRIEYQREGDRMTVRLRSADESQPPMTLQFTPVKPKAEVKAD